MADIVLQYPDKIHAYTYCHTPMLLHIQGQASHQSTYSNNPADAYNLLIYTFTADRPCFTLPATSVLHVTCIHNLLLHISRPCTTVIAA
jgi:hypothetical protein